MLRTFSTIFILILYSSVFAQDHYFLDETSTRLPFTNKICVSADGADIDGDGDIDILASVDMFLPPFIPCYLFVNDGNGYFTQENMTRLPDTSLAFYGVEFGDVDADGDYDAYFVSENNQDLLYINDGFGYFSDQTYRLPSFTSVNSFSSFADFSNDMFWDIIVICHYDGLNRFLLNDVNGYFIDVTSNRMPIDTLNDSFGAVADLDNDLDLDLLLSWMGVSPLRHIRGLENIDGQFVNFENGRLDDRLSLWIDTGDIDGDGDLDILVSGVTSRGVLINYNGTFVDESEARLPDLGPQYGGSTMLGLGDFDNDSDIDIYTGFGVDAADHFFINDGNGYFSLGDERIPDTEASTWWIEPFDADADGDLDIFLGCAGDGYQRILINYSTPDTIPPKILAEELPLGLVDSLEEYWFNISVYDNITVEKGKLEVGLVYQINGAGWDTLSLRHCGGTLFKKTISDLPVGTFVEYYVYIRDRIGNSTYSPENAPDSVHTFTVASNTGINSVELLLPNDNMIIFPNPSNSTFNIKCYLAGEKQAKLSVYGLTGRELYSEFLNQNNNFGWYTWNWAGWRELPSGIYFIQLQTPLRKEVKKAVLIH
jgi:hypothetical protein